MHYYFITGTSRGIGKALVEELISYPQHKVVGLSRTNTINEEQFEHRVIDLSNLSEVLNFSFGELHKAHKIVLINNAGTLGSINYVGKQNDQSVVDVINVNYTAAALLMNKFIESYQHENVEKIIINISSGAATSPYDGWSNYCSSKAALNMFTEVVHKEQQHEKFPVQAYAIAPGVVDTFMQQSIRETDEQTFKQKAKFVELKQTDALYTATEVAKKIHYFIQNPSQIPGIISRIKL